MLSSGAGAIAASINIATLDGGGAFGASTALVALVTLGLLYLFRQRCAEYWGGGRRKVLKAGEGAGASPRLRGARASPLSSGAAGASLPKASAAQNPRMMNNPLHTLKEPATDGGRRERKGSATKSPRSKKSPAVKSTPSMQPSAGLPGQAEGASSRAMDSMPEFSLLNVASNAPSHTLDAPSGAATASPSLVAAGSAPVGAAAANPLPGTAEGSSGAGAGPAEPPQPLTTDKVSAKEWGLLRRASMRSLPAEFAQKLVSDAGKLSIPKGWKKLLDGSGYVRAQDGVVVGHLNEVLEMEMEGRG